MPTSVAVAVACRLGQPREDPCATAHRPQSHMTGFLQNACAVSSSTCAQVSIDHVDPLARRVLAGAYSPRP